MAGDQKPVQSAQEALLTELLGDIHKLRTEVSDLSQSLPEILKKLLIAANHLSKKADGFKAVVPLIQGEIDTHIDKRLKDAEVKIGKLIPELTQPDPKQQELQQQVNNRLAISIGVINFLMVGFLIIRTWN